MYALYKMSYPYNDKPYNEKNTSKLLGDLIVGRNADVKGDLTAEHNINMGDVLQSTTPVIDDTVFIKGSLDVNGLFTVDETTGLVQVANDLVVYGKLVVPEVDYAGIVTVGDYITFNGYEGKVSALNVYAASGCFDSLCVSQVASFDGPLLAANQTGVFGTVIADRFIGPLSTSTGVFDTVYTNNLYVQTGAFFQDGINVTGTINLFSGDLIAPSSTGLFGTVIADTASFTTGHFDSLTVDNLDVLNNAHFTGTTTFDSSTIFNQTSTFYSTLDASAATGLLGSLQVSQVATFSGALIAANQTGIFGTIIADNFIGPISTSSGVFDSVYTNNLFVQTGAYLNGFVQMTGTFSLTGGDFLAPSSTGLFGTVDTTDLNVSGVSSFSGALIAAGQTGVFGTVIADNITLNNDLTVQNLTVEDTLTLGNQIVPLDPLVSDTLFIDSGVNIANIATFSKDTGEAVFAGDVTIFGALNLDQVNYTGKVLVGDEIELNGTNGSITAKELYVSTGSVYIGDVQLSSKNNFDLYLSGGLNVANHTGVFGTVIADKFVGPMSLSSGSFDNLTVGNLTVSSGAAFNGLATFQTIDASTGVFDTIYANTGFFNTIVYNTETITTSTTTNLLVQNMTGTNVYITNLTGANAVIASLTGTTLSYLNATIQTLTGTNAVIDSLTGTNLSYLNITGTNVSFVNATGSSLTADTVQASTILSSSVSASSLSVTGSAFFFGTTSFSGALIATSQTGVFGTIIADNFVGPISTATGVFQSITTDYLVVNTEATFSGAASFYQGMSVTGTLYAPDSTGVFGTLQVAELELQNLTVVDTLTLGNQIVPLDPVVSDTLFIDNNVNIANIATFDKQTGEAVFAGDVTIFGALNLDQVNYTGKVLVGDEIELNGTNGSITAKELYVSTGSVYIGDVQLSSQNNFDLYLSGGINAANHTGVFGTVIADKFVGPMTLASGSFDNLIVGNLTVSSGAAFNGTATFSTINSGTGVFQTLYANTGYFNTIVYNTETITTSTTTNLLVQNMTGTNVYITNLTGTNAVIASLTGTSLSYLNATIQTLTGTNAVITSLTGTTLSYLNASVATLTGANAVINSLTGTNLSYLNASVSNLTGTNLFTLNATVDTLTGTNAVITSLTGINLSYLNVTGTNLNFVNATGSILSVQTATASSLIATSITSSTLSVTGTSTFYGLVDASGQTGVFGTLTADNLTFTDATVSNNLYVGNQILPLNSTVNDSVFIDGNVNVADVFTINKADGLVTVANDMVVYGQLSLQQVDFAGTVLIGDYVVFDAPNGSITSTSLHTTTLSTVNVGCDLVPSRSGTFSLGSVDKPWKELYVGTGSIYLGPTLNLSSQNGIDLNVNGAINSTGTSVFQSITGAKSITTKTLVTDELDVSNIVIPAYFNGTPATSYSIGSALRGQVYVPDTYSSVTVSGSKVFATSFINGIMASNSVEAVIAVVPSNGSFTIKTSGSSGNRLVNFMIVN